MTARTSEGTWTPLPGSLPDEVDPETVYILPTKLRQNQSSPLYADAVRMLPKRARLNQIPVEFASRDERQFLSEYSIDPEMWALALACLQMSNDWIIATVTLYLSHRADTQGWSLEEVYQQPLRVNVVETSTSRSYEVEGTGSDVIEALKVLQRDSHSPSDDDGSVGE